MEKPDGRQVDLENQQIRATRMPKMEPESSKWLRRASKKGPMKQQGAHETSKETKEVTAGSHGKAKWSPRGRLATKSKPTWVQQGSKKVPKKGPNERP